MPTQKPHRSRQDYATPRAFLDAVKTRLGITEFAHDFAADATNTVASTWFDEAYDALSADALNWSVCCEDGWGWLNPRFTKISPWAARCAETREAGGHIALLVPAAVGANWFRYYVDGQARVLFLNGRLCFIADWATTIDPATLKPGKGPARCYTSPPLYPKDCILCLYGPDIEPGYEVWNWRW